MQQSRARHVCFYSNRCQWSKAFLTELAHTPYKTEFKYICVDPSPNRPKLPGFLKKVPTILIEGEGEPRTDGDVMNWLAERRLVDDGSQGGGGGAAGDPMEYYSCEMDAIGQDLYSFIDSDTSISGDGGNRITQAFSFINEAISGAIGAASQAVQGQGQGGRQAQGQQKSKKEQVFDAQMEAYMKSRDMGMPQIKPRL